MSDPTSNVTLSKEELAWLIKAIIESLEIPDWTKDDLTVLGDILRKVKNIKKTDKARYLYQITTYIRTATFVAGDHVPSLREIKRILDDTLRSHQIRF